MKEIRGGIDFDSEGNMIGRLGRAKDYFFEKNPSDGHSEFGDYVRSKFRKKTDGGKRKSKAKKSKKSKKGSRKNKTRRR